MSAIQGNTSAIRELAGQLNCDFNALNSAICDVRGGIDRLSGQVGFSAERVVNAVNMGDCNIISALKDCCCQNKELVQRMGYENQINNLQQSNAIQAGFAYTNTGIERGFSNVAFETQKQTCDIINAGNANTQRIIDTLNCHWNQDLQQRYNDARLELSQRAQNEYLISQLKTTTTTPAA